MDGMLVIRLGSAGEELDNGEDRRDKDQKLPGLAGHNSRKVMAYARHLSIDANDRCNREKRGW